MACGGYGRVLCSGTWLVLLLALGQLASAAVYPGAATSDSHGAYEGIYMVLRDAAGSPLSQARIDQIRASELISREFYAVNSGGAYDLRYTHILDVPLTLNEDGTRIGDWWADAEDYVRSNYGIEPEDYHANLFDVSATTPDEGQGWSGIAIIPSNNYAVQADITTGWGQIVVDHELGHRIGAPHSSAWRTLNDGNYTPYVWNVSSQQYVQYDSAEQGHRVTAYGMHLDEYGNPFDVMGNISHGHFTVHEKLTNLHWLSDAQVPDLNSLGSGTYRIYSHDELNTAVDELSGLYGVEETYGANLLYGLTYTREAEQYNAGSNEFEIVSQTMTLEFRTGSDGVQFHLNDGILDLDMEGGAGDRNNTERALEVGQSIEDIELGMSVYQGAGEGDDFLSHNPPPPTYHWELADEWFEFTVLEIASDVLGSYAEIAVELLQMPTAGDINADGFVNVSDAASFRENWLANTSMLNSAEKFGLGDMDLNGTIDLDDAWLLKEILDSKGPVFVISPLIPEPATLASAMVACVIASAMIRCGSCYRAVGH